MMSIPLQGGAVNAHQQLTVQLGDQLVDLNLNYQQTGQWSLDISQEGVTLAAGAMLEPSANVIEAWPELAPILGALVFTGDPTTIDNLGVSNSLVWVSPDEL